LQPTSPPPTSPPPSMVNTTSSSPRSRHRTRSRSSSSSKEKNIHVYRLIDESDYNLYWKIIHNIIIYESNTIKFLGNFSN
jgi:hypothetical protein